MGRLALAAVTAVASRSHCRRMKHGTIGFTFKGLIVFFKLFITIFTVIIFLNPSPALSNQLHQEDTVSYSKIYQSTSFRYSNGAMGMDIIDNENTDYPYIVVGGGEGWSVVSYNPDSKEYDTIYHKQNREPIDFQYRFLMKVQVVNIPEVDFPLIITAYYDGLIEIFNGNTFEPYDNFSISTSHLFDFAIADANNDGKTDITISTEALYPTRTKIFVIDLDSHEEHTVIEDSSDATLAGYFRGIVKVGQVNEDEKLEIVLSSGAVFQVNGSSQEIVWSHDRDFGELIELGNIDDDEQLEIIGANIIDPTRSGRFYQGFDVVEQSTVWERESRDASSINVIDVTGDSIPEIILGDDGMGRISAIDMKTQEIIWFIDNQSDFHARTLQTVHDVVILDSDRDGNLEVVWGTGAGSGSQLLVVHDLIENETDWQSYESLGPFKATASGDLDNDGKLEMVYVEALYYGAGSKGSRIVVADAATRKIKFVSDQEFFNKITNMGFHDVKLANLDEDENLEIVVSSTKGDFAAVHILDGQNYQIQNTYLFDRGNVAFALETLDVDNDGVEEIIVGTGKLTSESLGTHVYAINAENGSLAWSSQTFEADMGAKLDIHIADINNDGRSDIVVSSSNNVSILNSETGVAFDKIPGEFNAIDLLQADSDEAQEILITKGNSVHVYDTATLEYQEKITFCDKEVKAIKVVEEQKIIVACGSQLMRYDFVSKTIDWSQETYDENIGLGNSITLQTVANKIQFLVSSTHGVMVFESSSNHLPVAEPSSFITHWRDELLATLSASDLDDNDIINYQLVENTTGGLVKTLAYDNGEFRYTPAPARGLDKFYFQVNDGASLSAVAEITIRVANNTPTLGNQSFSTDRTSIVSGKMEGEDPDGDPLFYRINIAPNEGTLTLDEMTGGFEYTPNSNTSTQDFFEIIASDSVDDSAAARVTISFSASSSEPSPTPTPEAKSSGGGGTMSIYLLILLLGACLTLRRE